MENHRPSNEDGRRVFVPDLQVPLRCPDPGKPPLSPVEAVGSPQRAGGLFKKLSLLLLLLGSGLWMKAQILEYHLLPPEQQARQVSSAWNSSLSFNQINGVGANTNSGMMLLPTEICNNGIDDDGDGYTDEFDPDCPNYAPFACDGRLYQTLIEGAGSPSIFYEVFTNPVQFDTISNLTALGFTPGINSIGYNPVDNFIYGINPSNPYQIIRINANGNFENVGNITGIPVNSNYAGDIDGNGIYYITGGSRGLFRIDLNGSGPNYPATQIGGTLPAAVADIAFNPVDSLLYGWNGSLWVINPQTGAMSNIGAAGTPMSSAGACYFNPQGELIIYENNPGRLAKVRLTDGFATVLGSGLRVNGNDGCSCAFGIELTKAASVTNIGGNSVFTYTFTIFNQSVATLPLVTFSDTLQGGLLWASEPQNINGGIAIGPTSLTGNSTANFSLTNIPPGQSSFTIDVITPNQTCSLPQDIPNRAYLVNLPLVAGADVASDDPNTPAIGDATVVTVTYDQTAPTAACQDVTIYVDGSGSASITANDIDNGSSDNCGRPDLSATPLNYSCANVNTSNIATLTVSDDSGNTATCTANVTVLDTLSPTISCPADITVAADPNSCDAVVSYTAPVGQDNCPNPTTQLTSGLGSGSTFPNGTSTETYTVTDASGNTASCSFQVTVQGGVPPTISCPANIVVSNDAGQCGASVNYNVTFSGGCGNVSLSQTAGLGSGSFFPIGTSTESYIVVDGANNSDSCSFTVTVNDTEDPVISCPANITVSNDAGQCSAVVSYQVSASDNCPGETTVQTAGLGSGATFPIGTSTESYTVTDAAGNTASCSFTVTVNDTEDPVISCPANITVSNDAGQCSAVVSYQVSASDNCPGETTAQTAGLGSGSAFPIGTSTESYTVTDAAGNTASCSFTVTVNDTEDPVISCPANITVSNDAGQCSAVVSYQVSASDNCPGETTAQTAGLGSGSAFSVGTTTESYTVTDAAGNTASCSFTVTVNDTEDPVISCPANIVVSNDAGQCSAVVSYTAPVGTDNCPGAVTVQSGGLGSGGTFPVGTTSESYTVTDAAGNTASCSFTVTVNDTENPTIACPANITVNNDPGICGAVVNFALPAVSDNCGGGAPVSTLGLGDLAFTGYNSDNPDAFSFVLLTDVAAGTNINFTDNGWLASGGFRVGEGIVSWNSGASDLPAGTEVQIIGSSASIGNIIGTGAVALSVGGDQLFAYQGNSTSNPNLITGIQMNGAWDADATSSNTSAQPAGFVDGVNSISIAPERDNAVYDCSVSSGSPAAIRAAVNTAANWSSSDNILALPTCGFSIPTSSLVASQTGGPASGSTFPVGTTTVSFEVTDPSGNTASCSFDVTVNDAEAPMLTCPANITVSNDAGICGAVVTYNDPVATDNCGQASSPVSTLSPGDIVFTGYRSDNPDSWSFVTLVDLAPNASIQFTDNGWRASGGFRAGEGILAWNAGAVIPAGTEIQIVNNVANIGTAFTLLGSVALSVDGDQLTAFQGTLSNPSLITSIQMNGAWDSDATSSNTSALPTGLVDGQTAISIAPEVDNAAYNCSTISGTPMQIRMAVYNSSNWTGNNSGVSLPTCNFAISGGLTPVLVSGPASGSTFPVGTTTVAWSVTDASGNVDTCSFTVTVEDTEDPVISCPANITVGNDAGQCAAVVSYQVTASDNCPGESLAQTAGLGSGASFPVGTTTESYTVTDAAGNTASCSFTVTVEDTEDPVISCPANITVGNDAGICGAAVSYTVNYSDNCPGVTLAQTAGLGSGATFPVGTSTESYTATDAAGNTASCSFTVTVNDTEDPVITCPASIQVACATDVPTPDSVINANDNCGVVSSGLLSESDNGGQGCASSPLVITRTYQATDAAGNQATCTQTITVIDDVAPVAICRDLAVTLDENGNASITASMVDNGSNDNCSGVSLSIDRDNFTCADTGNVVVTLTVTDDCGNSSTCTSNVTIEEGHFVEIICPDDIVTNCETGNGGAYVSWPEPTANAFASCSEPCPPTHISGFIYLGEYNGHRYYCSNNSNYTWTQANNLANQAGGYLAVINDAGENAYLQSQLMASYAWIGLTDEVNEGQFEWVNNDPLNYTNWQQGEPNNSGGNCCTPGGADHVALKRYNGKWYDRASCNRYEFIMEIPCGEPVTITQIAGPASGDLFPQGTTVVTYVASDTYGTTDTCSFTVTVEEVFEIVCPSDITVPCVNAHNGAYVTWDQPDVIFESCDTNACSQNTCIPGFTFLGEFNGNRYYLSGGSGYSWTQAQNRASQNGGYLAVINNAQENAFIRNNLNTSYAWIGLTDQAVEGQFEWVNGDPLNYTNWANNQPNNHGGNQDHVVIRRNNGQWYDMNSGCDRYKFVMEVPCSGYTLEQVAGPASGSHFSVGTTQVSYIAYTTGGDTVSCSFNVTVEECQPVYCHARGYCSNYEWIQSVQTGNISNNSGNDHGYGDYTSLSTTFSAGANESISLTPGFAGQSYREYWKVWIDWNRDGDFYDSGEMVYAGSGYGTVNGSIQVPSNAAQGALRMRVAMRWGCWPSGPCCNFHYGEVEDYTIYVSGAAKAGSPAAAASNDNALMSSQLDEKEAPSGLEFSQIYPNPVIRASASAFNLEFRSGKTETMILKVSDLNGRTLIKKSLEATKGMNRQQVEISQLPAGTYLVELGNGSVKKTEKLVVQ